MSCWHDFVINHIIPPGTSMEQIKIAFVFPTPSNFNLTLHQLALMIQAYFNKTQTILCDV